MLFRRTRTAKFFAEKGKDHDPWESPFVPLFEEDFGKKSGLVLTESAARSLEKLRDPVSSRSHPENSQSLERDAFWGERPGEVSFARLDAICAVQKRKESVSGQRESPCEQSFKNGRGGPEKGSPYAMRTSFRNSVPRTEFSEQLESSERMDPFQKDVFSVPPADVPPCPDVQGWRQKTAEKSGTRKSFLPRDCSEGLAEKSEVSSGRDLPRRTPLEALRRRLSSETSAEERQGEASYPRTLSRLRDGQDRWTSEHPHANEKGFLEGDDPSRSSPYAMMSPGQNEEAMPQQRPFDTPSFHPPMKDGRPLGSTAIVERLAGREGDVEEAPSRPLTQSTQPAENSGVSASLDAPIPPPPPIRQRRNFFSSDAFLTIVLAAGVLLLCVLLLWAVSRRETRGNSSNERDEVIIQIPSPKAFKVRPEEPAKPLIPYQDELIYGELDPRDKLDTKERILLPPSFAPELVIEKETSEDEYLDDDMEPIDGSGTASLAPQLESKKDTAQQAERENSLNMAQNGSLSSFVTKEKRVVSRIHAAKPLTKQNNSKTEKQSGPKPRSSVSSSEPRAQAATFYIQLGILPSIDVARKESARLITKYRTLARYNLIVRPVRTDEGRTIFRLLVGPFATKSQAEGVAKSLGVKFKILF